MRRGIRVPIIGASLLPTLTLACPGVSPQPEQKPTASALVAPAVDAAARQTALIGVRFSPDGTAVIETVSPRQILFPRAQVGAYDAELHAGRSGGGPIGLADDPALSSGEVADRGTSPAAHPMPARHDGSKHGAIVVRHPSLDAPIVTPVWLGHPGEAGGDVTDRWQNGGSILRAPYYGEGTRYTLVRNGAEKLAEWEGR